MDSLGQRIKRLLVGTGINDALADAFCSAIHSNRVESEALRRGLRNIRESDLLKDLVQNMKRDRPPR